jgi:class 3 adenylate cyclase
MQDAIYDAHEFTSIHAAVMFADLENSVMISSALSGPEYDRLINSFQQTMLELVRSLQEQGYRVGEYNVVGDQLSVFLYDPEEVARNYALDGPEPVRGAARAALVEQCLKVNQDLAISALKAAIQLKNRWLVQESNLERVLRHREPLGLAIGLHCGRVYLTNRADGTRRIEGYAINLGKRVESCAREGRYSRIMVSQKARDLIRTAVVKHTQLRQRIFFHRHDLPLELLKGVTRAQALYELKFYHRIGLHVPQEAIELYESIFAVDHTNLWAYNQLVDYYAYNTKDWERVSQLANIASVVHPEDEKVQYDLSKYYFQQGNLDMSQEYALEALRLNPGFDLAHEQLALIATGKDDNAGQIAHWRDAVRLSPNSAVNHYNLGLALIYANQTEAGTHHILEAVRIYPDYRQEQIFAEGLARLAEKGELPEQLRELLSERLDQASARITTAPKKASTRSGTA